MQRHRVIFITGATSGVGASIIEQLLDNKADVTLIATGRNAERLQALAKRGVTTIQADLAQLEQLDEVVAQLPEIDVAILNAGVGKFEYAAQLADEDIDDMIDLNIRAQMKLTKRILPKVQEQIIYIGSQAGKVATPKASVYAATKHALIGYTNALRMEQPRLIITVIHPGPIDSPFLDHADETKTYRQKMGNVLLTSKQVAKKTVATIGTKKREVNIPWYMGISSKLYALAPNIVETVGKSFFNKK